MYAWSPNFQINYGTSTPLRVAASSYTNETNVAQARPLEQIGIARPGIGLIGTQYEWSPGATSGPTPTNPAAPSPQTTTEQQNQQELANPVVWIGVAAGILVILWAMR